MSKSSLKIVLVDPLGDILFAGDSLIGPVNDDAPPPRASTTTTTTVSGIYPRRRIGVEETEDESDEAEGAPVEGKRTNAA